MGDSRRLSVGVLERVVVETLISFVDCIVCSQLSRGAHSYWTLELVMLLLLVPSCLMDRGCLFFRLSQLLLVHHLAVIT